MIRFKLLWMIALVGLMTGCGQKGPLYLEGYAPPSQRPKVAKQQPPITQPVLTPEQPPTDPAQELR